MNITLTGAGKAYGTGEARFWALRDADLSVSDGDFFAIVGPSGSGKSTLLHLLGCLDRPSEGEISVDGRLVAEMPDRELSLLRRDHIGFVFQQYFLNASMTALQNVLLPLHLAGVAEGRSKAVAALETVGLAAKLKSYPTEMSGGEQQRVAIARSLANAPSVLLADEPTGSLDSKTGKDVLSMLVRLNNERNLGVVIVTHDADVAATADRRIDVLDGRIAQ